MSSEHNEKVEFETLPPVETKNTSTGQWVNQNYRGHNKSNTGKVAGVSAIVCVFVAVLAGVIGFTLGTRMQNVSVNRPDYSELNEVYNVLASKYDGTLDKNKLIQGAAAGMAAATGDEYTSYLTADEANDLTDDLSGSFDGVGVEIGPNENKQLEVISVLEGGSAKKAGIRSGDLIVKIDGEDSISWNATQAANKIRGDAGTTVKLTIMRDNETKEYTLTRAKVDNPSVTWEIKDDIGYMTISQFGDDTAELATKAANEFKDKKVKGVVLDVRSNGGGYVDAAQAVASLWLNKGDVIVKEKSGNVVRDTLKATGDNPLKGIKTVVLIDGGTASASEIVAGALKDHDAATLVGTQSYGKGSVQELVNLSSGSELKVTVAKWYRPNGENINKKGIKPDEEVKMTAEEYNSGHDTQKDKATELLKK